MDLQQVLKRLEKEGLLRARLEIGGKLAEYSSDKWKISDREVAPNFFGDLKANFNKIAIIVGLMLLLYFLLILLAVIAE